MIVGDLVIRRKDLGTHIWEVTGVFLGIVGQETTITLKSLVYKPGVNLSPNQEYAVPLELLEGTEVYVRKHEEDKS